MTTHEARTGTGPSALVHLVASLAVGVIAGLVVAAKADVVAGALTTWAVAALLFVLWSWLRLWNMSAEQTNSHAVREDPGTAIRDVVLLGAGAASLVAVAGVLFQRSEMQADLIALSVVCIAGSWLVLHTIYALRYAGLYYGEPSGGLNFQQPDDPTYRDFAYLAFTVGMTFQVSDTEVQQRNIRSAVLRHALLSFVYNTVIVAVTVNLAAGLRG